MKEHDISFDFSSLATTKFADIFAVNGMVMTRQMGRDKHIIFTPDEAKVAAEDSLLGDPRDAIVIVLAAEEADRQRQRIAAAKETAAAVSKLDRLRLHLIITSYALAAALLTLALS